MATSCEVQRSLFGLRLFKLMKGSMVHDVLRANLRLEGAYGKTLSFWHLKSVMAGSALQMVLRGLKAHAT